MCTDDDCRFGAMSVSVRLETVPIPSKYCDYAIAVLNKFTERVVPEMADGQLTTQYFNSMLERNLFYVPKSRKEIGKGRRLRENNSGNKLQLRFYTFHHWYI